MSTYKLINGDCIAEMKKMDANSIDSIVTDPPYEIGFMGKGWDNTGIAYNKDMWKQALRVLKPGGHMLAFSSTRTYHRMVCAIEDAGFEIRDQLAWIYGSGFPKSQNVGKMIDKKSGAKRKVIGTKKKQDFRGANILGGLENTGYMNYEVTEPSTELAKKYDGWGTALKPAQEPIVLARKPISESTIAKNVVKHGTGAIDIDNSRVATGTDDNLGRLNKLGDNGWKNSSGGVNNAYIRKEQGLPSLGRWPANIIHDGSEEVLELFPDTKGAVSNSKKSKTGNGPAGIYCGTSELKEGYNDNGSAARFFYCAKANKQDRNDGCEEITAKSITNAKGNGLGRVCNICSASILKPCECENNSWILPVTNKNNHPTVKPTALMMYLIKLITPVGGTVLDPFNGSGSTGKAAMLLKQYNYIGIDLSAEYIKISKHRIEAAIGSTDTDKDKQSKEIEEDTQFFFDNI